MSRAPTKAAARRGGARAANPREIIAPIASDYREVDSAEELLGVASARVAARGSLGDRHFDAAWFLAFVGAHFRDKSKQSAEPGPVVATARQREEWAKLIVLDEAGQLVPHQWVVSWPRREGKTQWCGYYELTRCLVYPNQLCVIQAGGGEEQGENTALARHIETIQLSDASFHVVERRTRDSFSCDFHPRPGFAGAAPGPVRVDVLGGRIRFGNGSEIIVIPAGESAAYGLRTSVFRGTELHLAKSADGYLAGKGGTGDAWNGVAVIDSTQGDKENIVARATEAGELARVTRGAQGDAKTAVSHVFYKDLADACARAPSWITPAFLRSQAALMTPSSFRRNHLNRPTGAGETVFSEAWLAMARAHRLSPLICQEPWADAPGSYTPREIFRELRKEFRGHGLLVGIGVDRSSGREGSDRTVVVASAMGVDASRVRKACDVFGPEGDVIDRIPAKDAPAEVVFPLAVVTVPGAGKSQIRRTIKRLHKLYGDPWGIAFEEYQSRDLHEWAERVGYDATLEPMTAKAKHEHVLAAIELLSTGRLALPGGDAGMRGGAGLLNIELGRYEEVDTNGAHPKYEGPKGFVPFALRGEEVEAHRVKDDSTEGFFWSTYPIRESDPGEME